MEWTDWNAAVEKNREALKRVLATLVGMAGPGSDRRSFWFLRKGDGGSAGDRLLNSAERRGASGLMLAELSKLSPALPRHLHRAMLMLLRPAEAAARRLVIAAARGLVAELPPPRRPEPMGSEPLLDNPGITVAMPPAGPAHAAAAGKAAGACAARPRAISLPLLDPLKNPFGPHRHFVPAHAVPRIMPFGGGWLYRSLPPPPSRNDPIDAARLSLRLAALAAALDDLPAQARRFARWQARNGAAIAHLIQGGGADAQDATRDTAPAQDEEARGAAAQDTIRHTAGPQGKQADTPVRFRRPLKPSRPQGWRRKPAHAVRENVNIVHGFAFRAREPPDTS